jgi:hypothetical protein
LLVLSCIDRGFVFLTPLSANFVPAQPVWIFRKKLIKKNCFYFFDKLVLSYFTSFSNFILSTFRSEKDSFIKSIFSLSVPLKVERRALVETKNKNHGRGGD